MVQQITNNQFAISTNNAKYFQSYNSIVCKIDKKTNHITLSQHWDYSVTTAKHLYRFLRENTALQEVNKKALTIAIKQNDITLVEVNSLDII